MAKVISRGVNFVLLCTWVWFGLAGVQAISMDTSEGLLTVTGDVEPFLLIEMVEKGVRKRVELWSFQRYPARASGEDGGGDRMAVGEDNGGGASNAKEADLRRARDRKKAARRRADREKAGQAGPAPMGPCWPGPGGYHPMAGPCQYQGDPGQPPFWRPYRPPPPMCYGPPQFPPPYHWYYPMPPPPVQPPPPYYYHHEAQQPKQ